MPPKLKKLLVFSGLLFIAAIAVYVFNFHRRTFSDKSEDWGAFGSYLSVTVALINTVIVTYISIIVFELQQNRDSFEKTMLEAEQQPIIIFGVDPINAPGRWYIHNVGKGAALNLVISYTVNDTSPLTQPYRCYSIPPGDKFTIPWPMVAWECVCLYQDIFGKDFIAICHGDETRNQEFSMSPDFQRFQNMRAQSIRYVT